MIILIFQRIWLNFFLEGQLQDLFEFLPILIAMPKSCCLLKLIRIGMILKFVLPLSRADNQTKQLLPHFLVYQLRFPRTKVSIFHTKTLISFSIPNIRNPSILFVIIEVEMISKHKLINYSITFEYASKRSIINFVISLCQTISFLERTFV